MKNSKAALLLGLLATYTYAQTQVSLTSAQVSLDSSFASAQTDSTLEIFRQNNGPSWQPNQCFELYVSSPYLDPSLYSTFLASNPPTCTAVTAGVTVECTVRAADSLSLVFTTLSAQASTSQSIRIKLTNFYTPFSAQLLSTMNMRSYSDTQCQRGMKTVSLSTITIQQATLPVSQVKLSSTTDTLGSTAASNALVVKFTPLTTMDPSGSGKIHIGIPLWYQIGNTGQYMYNPTAINKCSSDCMDITYSAFVTAAINIEYSQMLPSCIKNTEITITCRQFYNPITQEEWTGFSVSIFDNQIDSRIIEQTKGELKFDATKFKPMMMPSDSFTVEPANSQISTYSTWTLQLQVNIPLQTECYIKVYLPSDLTYTRESMQASGIFVKPSLDPTLKDEDLSIIFRTADGTIPKSSVVFAGCNLETSLGNSPFGRLDMSEISTQAAIKDSETFEIQIFKDKELTLLIAELSEPGVSISGSQLTPGTLSEVSILPEDTRVQRISPLVIIFTISHALNENASLLVRLPTGLTTPQGGSTLLVTSPDSSTSANEATVLPGNIIEIPNLVAVNETLAAGTVIQIAVNGIANQNSVRDAGDFEITTRNKIDGQDYTVDYALIKKSFIATTGRIDAVGEITIPNAVNYDRANIYSLTFVLEDVLPKAGYIMVQLPSELQFSPSTTQSSGSCKKFTCTQANETTVIFLMQQGLEANKQITLDIGGIINPRSFKPSGPIVLTTLDTDAESQIDSGYSLQATMLVAGDIESFSVQQDSFINGNLTEYTFSVQAKIPVASGDQLIMTLPSQIVAPEAPLNCTGIQNLIEVECKVDGQQLTFTFISFSQGTGSFTWSITGVKNPPSTKTSDIFQDVTFTDAAGFKVSSYQGQAQSVTNKYPAQLVVYNITQTSLTPEAVNQYEISFTPVNPLPQTGSIQVSYPSQITLTQGALTVCTVTTETQSFSNACVIDATAQTITIKSLFVSEPSAYGGKIAITLDQVKNAINNKPGNGFVISTYADVDQTYIVDKLNDFVLTPLFECEYPCQTCSPTNRKSCVNCWPNFDDPNYLMFYADGTASCRSFCDPGNTTNGNSQKHCEACDPSCGTCAENRQVGDKSLCIDCAPEYKFRLSMSQTCLKDCTLGMYRSTNTSCSLCRSPCEGCNGTESTCTSCKADGPLSQLYGSQCVGECPIGHVSVNNVCQKCESPCATCSGRPDGCDTCDGSAGTKFTFQKKCWADCPAGSAPNTEDLSCFSCLPGCDLCDINNQTLCLKCTKPSLAYEGECLDSCPSGWAVNSDETACRPWQLSDLGILPFPFLITAAVATIVCLFGMIKRRAYLSHGKMATYSPQHTLTCIIVCIAPLQFFATITQWVLSYVYGTTTFCILAALVTVAAIIVNIVFQIMFVKNFDSKKIPTDIDRKVRLGKMTPEEAKQFLGPRDEKFNNFKQQNRCTTYTIFAFSAGINYKFNKLFYSFFYDLKKFQAHFSRAKYYRKMQTWYSILYLICVDLALICIDVTALTQIEQGNQLFITLIETLVLSILSIILGSTELWLLKRTLKYTEPMKDKSALKLGSGIGSDSEDQDNLDKKYDKGKMAERRKQMAGLLRQVKHNKQLFLNNKLDELIHAFGDRRCKSMMDLGTGMDLEDDPQERVTYPISPQMRQDYNEMDLMFRPEDAYGLINKPKIILESPEKDVGYEEFKEAMRRKQDNSFFHSSDNDLEERRNRRQRRRGRKNKFHAQIDQEDHDDLDHVEASGDDEQLQIIKEQELEEEKELRKVQKAKAPTAAEMRRTQLQEEALAKQQKDLAEAEARKANTMEMLQMNASSEQKKRDTDAKLKSQELSRQQAKIKAESERARSTNSSLKPVAKKPLQMKTEPTPQAKVDVPPQARTFNENDVYGDLDRDEKGNVVVPESGQDKSGKLVNARGYLVDTEGNVINNLGSELMFKVGDLDERGEIPPPFSLERFNFNAQEVMGDFDYKNKKPQVLGQKSQHVDKKGRRCTKQGWLISNQNSLLDIYGRKKLDSKQMTDAGDLLKLYNFAGKRFDIKDVMGQFERDQHSRISPITKEKGLFDQQGRLVNSKGYLIDKHGNIVDVKGAVIWKAKDLTNGEFQKIFPFTKFNIARVKGDFECDPSGAPILNGNLDNQNKLVNQRGYLVDSQGNVIDSNNFVVFEKDQLDADGEIPQIFRSGVLKSETGSEMSRLMSEIEKHHVSDGGQPKAAETSLDSQMEDTPANYNQANQRVQSDLYQGTITEESQTGLEKKQKSSRKKLVTVLQPSSREKIMAGAYGGQAIGEVKRPNVKYDKERLKDSMKFRVSAEEEPQLRATLNKLVKSGSRLDALQGSVGSGSGRGSVEQSPNQDRPLFDERQKRMQQKKQMKDGEFEELFGKDIDQFLEDSEWDMKSIDKVSEQNQLRQIEQEYLNADMSNQNKKTRREGSSSGRKKSLSPHQDKGPDRETILSFSDDPGVIHRGEILPFKTKQKE